MDNPSSFYEARKVREKLALQFPYTPTLREKAVIIRAVEKRRYSHLGNDCARWNISKSTYYRWKKQVDADDPRRLLL